MAQYILRRIVQAISLLLLISIASFALMHLIPGGPLAAYENNPNISSEDLARLREELGLNAPLHVQYVSWFGKVVHGAFHIRENASVPITRDTIGTDGTILWNSSVSHGGRISVVSLKVTVTGLRFWNIATSNTSIPYGGGFYFGHSTGSPKDNSIGGSPSRVRSSPAVVEHTALVP